MLCTKNLTFIFFLKFQKKLIPLSLDLRDTSVNRSSEGMGIESSGQPDMMTPDEAEQLLSTK